MPCHCGCDTKANRIKFIVSGVLFLTGWACIFLMVGIDDCDTGTYNRACNRGFVEGEEEMNLDYEAQSPSDQAALQGCNAAKQVYDDCWNNIWPGMMFLMFVWLVSWVGAVVPLFVMCCCTENPHEMYGTGTVPIHLQMTTIPPTGSVYAPSQSNQSPFSSLQGSQENFIDNNAGLSYAAQKPLEDDIPMYTAQVLSQTGETPQQESTLRLDES